MILRRISLLLFSLANAAILPLSALDDGIKQLSIKDIGPVKAAEFSDPLLPLEDVISQGDALHASTLNDDIETVVSKLNQQLSDLLNSGVTPLDAVPIINCFPFAAEMLVLTAIKVQAHILLMLLQLIYIWRDDAQFHWFQALSYNSPWYNEEWWNARPMDWGNNLQVVCAWDNVALAEMIQKGISPDALEAFNKNLTLHCVRNDAIKIFEAMRMNLVALKKYFGLLVESSSVKLLKIYQTSINVEHLHLEKFPLSKKLPANVDGFAFLMRHGFDCLPMDQLIERFCREGRLDLLKHLHTLESILIPNERDLMLAGKKGWLDILQWAHQLGLLGQISKNLAIKLAVNEHFKALDWLANEYKIVFDDEIIEKVIVAGKPNVLQWIYERQPFEYKENEWISLGIENRHLPILKWIEKTFGRYPAAYGLQNATTEILDWRKTINDAFINEKLVEYGAANFELLQWIHKNGPISILNGNKLTLSLAIHNKTMMKWLYNELRICPAKMNWAYEKGDLEAVQWALENCQVIPRTENIVCAIENGCLNIIKWIHENYPKHLGITEVLKNFKNYGDLLMMDYIISNFEPDKKMIFNDPFTLNTDWNAHVKYIKWIRERKYAFGKNFLVQEMNMIASSGKLQPFWDFRKAFPEVYPTVEVLYSLASHGHQKAYKWFIKNWNEKTLIPRLCENIQIAFKNGHLKIVRVILQKYPKVFKNISKLEVTRENFHIKRWLDTNFKPPKKSIFK